MLNKIKSWFKKPETVSVAPKEQIFSTDVPTARAEKAKALFPVPFDTKSIYAVSNGVAMDSAKTQIALDSATALSRSAINDSSNVAVASAPGVPITQMNWFASQSFLGYGIYGIMAQQWLINKVCEVPGQDACRNGWEITVNDGTDVDIEIIKKMRDLDKKYRVVKNLEEFSRFRKIFGIRIMLFKVDYDNPVDAYLKPFNIDGIKPGSYKGMVQIDPYWIVPQFDIPSSSDPASEYFYEPTWWQVNGVRYHRTHLVVTRNTEVIDLLKPSYQYGGVSVPQMIYERVYAAERTANEAPHLALTKRTGILKSQMEKYVTDPALFEQKLQNWVTWRDNYGIKPLGLKEEYQQHDTTLTDLDRVIFGQYELVCSIANIPITKVMGTSPKGMNATGEYDEASYHESLETEQTHFLEPVLARHYELILKSEILPKNAEPFTFEITWNPLDTPTAKELAETNKIKAETDAILVNAAILVGDDARKRIVSDEHSGYNGLIDEEMPETDLELGDDPLNGFEDEEV